MFLDNLPVELVLTYFFILGALFGSFANVVILRLPLGQSLIRPGSTCPHCQKPIAWKDKIPILSWFFLKGKCRHCSQKISFRYVLVEVLMATLFAAAFYKYGWTWSLVESLLFLFGLVTVSFIDIDHYLLPDKFTLSGIVIGLIGASLSPERSFFDALAGLIFGGGILWSIAYIYFVFRKQEGMGGGDIKLLAWIGAVLGWKSIPFVILASSLIGTIFGLALGLKNKQGLKSVIPFGPYLALGAVMYMFFGQDLARWYIQLFIPALE